MSPPIELSTETFARLQAYAVPFIDHPEDVIKRFAEFYEKHHPLPGAPVEAIVDVQDDVRRCNPVTPPDLTHTKVLTVEFGGERLERSQANWNGLLIAAVLKAKAEAKSAADFKRIVVVNFVDGQKTDEGYRFLRQAGISVQGQDANASWRAACHIAQELGCHVLVNFAWRQKEGAAFPGETGQFLIPTR